LSFDPIALNLVPPRERTPRVNEPRLSVMEALVKSPDLELLDQRYYLQ
jgi:hypothetical protein